MHPPTQSPFGSRAVEYVRLAVARVDLAVSHRNAQILEWTVYAQSWSVSKLLMSEVGSINVP